MLFRSCRQWDGPLRPSAPPPVSESRASAAARSTAEQFRTDSLSSAAEAAAGVAEPEVLQVVAEEAVSAERTGPLRSQDRPRDCAGVQA